MAVLGRALLGVLIFLSGFSVKAYANEDVLRGILGGAAVILNQINRDRQADPQRAQPQRIQPQRGQNGRGGARSAHQSTAQEAVTREKRIDVQRKLNLLGYEAGQPDGVFGPRTRSAISAFQVSIGHAPTGHITEQQIAILHQRSGAPTTTSPQGGFPTFGGVAQPAQQAFPSVVASDQQGGVELRADRAEVQQRLNLLGFDTGQPDGVFGPRTRSAISGFQASIGHTPTGHITEQQIAILNQRSDALTSPQHGVRAVAEGAGQTSSGDPVVTGLGERISGDDLVPAIIAPDDERVVLTGDYQRTAEGLSQDLYRQFGVMALNRQPELRLIDGRLGLRAGRRYHSSTLNLDTSVTHTNDHALPDNSSVLAQLITVAALLEAVERSGRLPDPHAVTPNDIAGYFSALPYDARRRVLGSARQMQEQSQTLQFRGLRYTPSSQCAPEVAHNLDSLPQIQQCLLPNGLSGFDARRVAAQVIEELENVITPFTGAIGDIEVTVLCAVEPRDHAYNFQSNTLEWRMLVSDYACSPLFNAMRAAREHGAPGIGVGREVRIISTNMHHALPTSTPMAPNEVEQLFQAAAGTDGSRSALLLSYPARLDLEVETTQEGIISSLRVHVEATGTVDLRLHGDIDTPVLTMPVARALTVNDGILDFRDRDGDPLAVLAPVAQTVSETELPAIARAFFEGEQEEEGVVQARFRSNGWAPLFDGHNNRPAGASIAETLRVPSTHTTELAVRSGPSVVIVAAQPIGSIVPATDDASRGDDHQFIATIERAVSTEIAGRPVSLIFIRAGDFVRLDRSNQQLLQTRPTASAPAAAFSQVFVPPPIWYLQRDTDQQGDDFRSTVEDFSRLARGDLTEPERDALVTSVMDRARAINATFGDGDIWLAGTLSLGAYDEERQVFVLERPELAVPAADTLERTIASSVMPVIPPSLLTLPVPREEREALRETLFQGGRYDFHARIELGGRNPTVGPERRNPTAWLLELVVERPATPGNRQGTVGVVEQTSIYRGLYTVENDIADLGQKPETSSLDILGVTLDLSIDEAEAVLRRANASIAYERLVFQANSPSDGLQPFHTGRLLWAENAQDSFLLYNASPAGAHDLIGLSRLRLFLDGQRPTPDSIFDALAEKYGKPFDEAEEERARARERGMTPAPVIESTPVSFELHRGAPDPEWTSRDQINACLASRHQFAASLVYSKITLDADRRRSISAGSSFQPPLSGHTIFDDQASQVSRPAHTLPFFNLNNLTLSEGCYDEVILAWWALDDEGLVEALYTFIINPGKALSQAKSNRSSVHNSAAEATESGKIDLDL